MKTKQRRKSSEPPVPEPSWRKQPTKRRPKIHQNKAVITHLPRLAKPPAWRPWAIRLPRVSWRYLVLLPVAALLIFAVIELFTNDVFFVFSADIRGNQRVAADEIYATTGIDGKNILWVNPADVRRKVEAVPGIESAHVYIWPPNQVTIDVQEQVPLVIWQVGDKTTWIADNGLPMPEVGTAPTLTMVDADGAAADQPAQSPATGSPAAVREQLRSSVVAALKVLHTRRPGLTHVAFGRNEGLYFVAAEDGWTVYLGENGDIGARLDLLAASRATLAGEKVKPKVVDLRLENRLIYR